MKEEEFYTELNRISNEYDRLTRAMVASTNENQQEIYAAQNRILNQELNTLFLVFTTGVITDTYLNEGAVFNDFYAKQSGIQSENLTQYLSEPLSSPYASEIQELINDYTESLNTVTNSSFSYKQELSQNIARAKSNFERERRRAERRIKRGVQGGKSFKEMSRRIENQYRSAIDNIFDSSKYMFRDAGNKRWQYESYARMQTSIVAGNTELDTITDQSQRAGSDIAKIPFTRNTTDPCKDYQGKYVSISGVNAGKMFRGQVLLSLPVLRDPAVHIFHPHCTHFALEPVALTDEEEERLDI